MGAHSAAELLAEQLEITKRQLEAERAKLAAKDEALRYLAAEAESFMSISCGCAGITNRRCLEFRIEKARAAFQAPEVKA